MQHCLVFSAQCAKCRMMFIIHVELAKARTKKTQPKKSLASSADSGNIRPFIVSAEAGSVDIDVSAVDRHVADPTFMQETVCVHAQTCSYPVGHVFMSWITTADGQDADHRLRSLTGSLVCCLLSLTLPFTYSSYYCLPQPQYLPKPNPTVVIMRTCSTRKKGLFFL